MTFRHAFTHPLAFGSLRSWLSVLRENGGVDAAYLDRALFITLVSASTLPLRLLERVRYSARVNALELPFAPIFIIGHWRSGTTHLHNILSADANLGYVTLFQTLIPDACLIRVPPLKRVMARLTPRTRMMDNLPLSLDGPQEEEFALANMSPYSFYHHWSFPRHARAYFDKYALFQNVSPAIIRQWQSVYLNVLRKATLLAGNKRLVIKNPTDTGRIPVLLDLFPDARFIHIYRNPYIVFPSTLHFYERVLQTTQLQTIRREELEANVLYFYQAMMQKFWKDQARIPPEHLVEVRFEDLETDPLAQVRRVYDHLGMEKSKATDAALRAYIASQKNYRKNTYRLDPASIQKVNEHWGFAVAKWEYDPR